jgi:signal transduction histidine kinase
LDDAAYAREAHNHAVMTQTSDTCPMDNRKPIEAGQFSESELRTMLEHETRERYRAECMASIQSHAVQLTLDLIVREPDPDSFFRLLMKGLLDHTESQACGVWLLDEEGTACELWMAYVGDRFYSKESADWGDLALARQEMATHLLGYAPGWSDTIEYSGDDPRLPDAVCDFDVASGLKSVTIVPLILPTRTLGWIALSTADSADGYGPWRRATVEAIARQVALALHQNRSREQSLNEARHQAVLEERNRIARDIHDTLAQGFAGILMQLQAVQRQASFIPPKIARSIDAAVDLARTHMIEARRSVGALHPQDIQSGDVAAVLERTAELARRTTDVPIELVIEDLPALGAGIEREIAGIAQEALTNAVRHARAGTIRMHASSTRSVGFRLSVADDGRGIARERFGAGFGLTSMQERAERIGGSLTIVTAPREGTEVVLAWEPPAFTIAAP